jgi:hypothetical protein
MPIYNCEKCQYTTTVKCNFEKHLKTKLHEKNVSKVIQNGQNVIQNYPQGYPKLSTGLSKIIQESINEEENNDIENDNKYICKICQNRYKYNTGLSKHYKKCKEASVQNLMKELEEKDKVLEEKEKEIEEIKKQLEAAEVEAEEQTKTKTKTTINKNCHNRNTNTNTNTNTNSNNHSHNNNTVNNTVNNINIVPYIDTDSSHLTDKDFLAIVNRVTYCVMDMIEKVHFNPNRKENMNLRLTNLKDNLMMVFEKENWTTKYKKDVLETLYVEKEMEIEDWIREEQYKYPNAKKKFDKYLNNKESDETMNKVKDDIKLMMYNKTREYKI